MSDDRKQREAALQRRFGMSAGSLVRLREFNEAQTDWEATCPICKVTLRGTLEELRKHKHGATR